MTTRNALTLELIDAKLFSQMAFGTAFGPNGRFVRVPAGEAYVFAAKDCTLSDVPEPVCFGVSPEDLIRHCNERMAFEAVQNPTHWKGAVDAIIRTEHATVVSGAIECFTATKATVKPIGDGKTFVHITTPGYWAGPAA